MFLLQFAFISGTCGPHSLIPAPVSLFCLFLLSETVVGGWVEVGGGGGAVCEAGIGPQQTELEMAGEGGETERRDNGRESVGGGERHASCLPG